MQLVALLRLGFPSAPDFSSLTLPATITRRTVLQKVRGCSFKELPQLVNTGFQVLFHSPPGVLFTFPSRYCFTIGHQVVFSLGRWSSLLPTRFPVSRGTLDPASLSSISPTGFSPSLIRFPKTVRLLIRVPYAVHNPAVHAPRFGLFPFRSPLLWKSRFLSSPRGT